MTDPTDSADNFPPYASDAYASQSSPSYEDSPPSLIAGALCLDFANTLNRRHERSGERLTSYQELLLWSRAAEIIDKQDVRDLGYRALAAPEAAASALANAIALREALASLLTAPAGTHPEAMTLVNGFLARAPERRRLSAEGGAFGWRVDRIDDDLERPLWSVLWDATALLTSGRLDRVRACAAEDCGWLFLDETRNRSRRWCSMEDCGNRAKARRHYAKKKAGSGKT